MSTKLDWMQSEDYNDNENVDGTLRSADEARKWAISRGLLVVTPRDNQLFLDLDTQEQVSRFMNMYQLLGKFGMFKSYSATYSRSGPPHKHIVVELTQDLSPVHRTALQAILGSDPLREFHNIRRDLDGDIEPIMFFEEK